MEEFDLTRKQVRKMIIALVGVLALLTTISVYAVENKENTETSVYELGKLIRTQVQTEKLEDEADPQEKSIYAKRNNIEITQEELEEYTERYTVRGYSENAEEMAYNDLVKRKALYQKALNMGYYVDDAELNQIIEENKEEMSDPEFKDTMDKLYESFDGEDNYWEYIREVTRVTATSSKFLNDEESKYRQEHGEDCYVLDEETGVMVDSWDAEKEEIINKIIADENMQLE